MNVWCKLFRREKPTQSALTSVGMKTDKEEKMYITCNRCNGTYKVRFGKFGIFAGCSNYPDCKSTLSLAELVLEFIKKYGLNIYRWERECYKCKHKTYVYSYYLNYELEDLDELFSMVGTSVGLGDLDYVDKLLSQQIPSIQMRYSQTTQSSYMANTCQRCGALQGRNYVVDDPHEIIDELWHKHNMDKFLFKTLTFENVSPLENDIKYLYSGEE